MDRMIYALNSIANETFEAYNENDIIYERNTTRVYKVCRGSKNLYASSVFPDIAEHYRYCIETKMTYEDALKDLDNLTVELLRYNLYLDLTDEQFHALELLKEMIE